MGSVPNEDNLFAAKGVLARGSDELVSLAAALAARAGRELATPDEARALLGIRARSVRPSGLSTA